MTTEQLAKAKELSEKINYMVMCVGWLGNEQSKEIPYNEHIFKSACYIAKDEVLPVFENKLQELKNELAEL